MMTEEGRRELQIEAEMNRLEADAQRSRSELITLLKKDRDEHYARELFDLLINSSDYNPQDRTFVIQEDVLRSHVIGDLFIKKVMDKQ